jgi:hypothetical protein
MDATAAGNDSWGTGVDGGVGDAEPEFFTVVVLRPDGTICHQLLADYQADGTTGGDGFFRLLRIWQDDRVQVRTFSPYVDAAQAFLTDERNQFDLQLALPAPQPHASVHYPCFCRMMWAAARPPAMCFVHA